MRAMWGGDSNDLLLHLPRVVGSASPVCAKALEEGGTVTAWCGYGLVHGGHEKNCQFGVEKHTGKWPLETGIWMCA